MFSVPAPVTVLPAVITESAAMLRIGNKLIAIRAAQTRLLKYPDLFMHSARRDLSLATLKNGAHRILIVRLELIRHA